MVETTGHDFRDQVAAGNDDLGRPKPHGHAVEDEPALEQARRRYHGSAGTHWRVALGFAKDSGSARLSYRQRHAVIHAQKRSVGADDRVYVLMHEVAGEDDNSTSSR